MRQNWTSSSHAWANPSCRQMPKLKTAPWRSQPKERRSAAVAEPEGGSQICESIWKQAIIKTEHQRCHATDNFFIHDIRNQLGLLSKEVNQDEMSDFLHDINMKRQETWNEADWHKSYIWSNEGALAILWQTVKKPDKDMSPVLLANLESAITLEECQYCHMMPVASDLKGTVDPPLPETLVVGSCWGYFSSIWRTPFVTTRNPT